MAVITRSTVSLEKLLKQGHCDVNAKDNRGLTALDWALQNNFLKAIALLIEAPDIDLSFEKFVSAAGFLKGYEKGLYIDYLITAIKKNDEYFIHGMIKRDTTGKLINEQNDAGEVPLVWAIRLGNSTLIDFLVKKGAKWTRAGVDQTSFKDQPTPMALVISDYPDVWSSMVSTLGDLNTADESGNAAMHYAVKFGKLDQLKELLNHSADPYLKNHKDEMPLDSLSQADFTDETLFIDIVKAFMQLKGFAEHPDGKKTLYFLINTCISKHFDQALTWLLENVDKSIIQQNHFTPRLLYTALTQKSLNHVQQLIKAGASVNAQSEKTGNTFLQLVLANYKNFSLEYVDILLKNGADINGLKNKKGQTAYDLAKTTGDVHVLNSFDTYLKVEKLPSVGSFFFAAPATHIDKSEEASEATQQNKKPFDAV